MDKDIKHHIINIMKEGTGGCKHQEMTQALNCSICKSKMIKAQSEYNRLRRQHPEKFIRKIPEEPFSKKTENLGDMLNERIKQDRFYQKHLKLLAFGTPEERTREMKRMESGFYEKNTTNSTKIIL